jgi:hypothetical protein
MSRLIGGVVPTSNSLINLQLSSRYIWLVPSTQLLHTRNSFHHASYFPFALYIASTCKSFLVNSLKLACGVNWHGVRVKRLYIGVRGIGRMEDAVFLCYTSNFVPTSSNHVDGSQWWQIISVLVDKASKEMSNDHWGKSIWPKLLWL